MWLKRFTKKIYIYDGFTGAQLGRGEGGDLPCPFLKIKKSALILSIFELNLLFKA